jgi:hypothetical protein
MLWKLMAFENFHKTTVNSRHGDSRWKMVPYGVDVEMLNEELDAVYFSFHHQIQLIRPLAILQALGESGSSTSLAMSVCKTLIHGRRHRYSAHERRFPTLAETSLSYITPTTRDSEA